MSEKLFSVYREDDHYIIQCEPGINRSLCAGHLIKAFGQVESKMAHNESVDPIARETFAVVVQLLGNVLIEGGMIQEESIENLLDSCGIHLSGYELTECVSCGLYVSKGTGKCSNCGADLTQGAKEECL